MRHDTIEEIIRGMPDRPLRLGPAVLIGAQKAPHRAEPTKIRKEIIMSNKPVLFAYTVKDRGRNQKAIWTRNGAAWPHEKGSGLTLELDALPIGGRIVLTEPKVDEVPQAFDAIEGETSAEAA
jgi:hypothetical protein